jgi:hypothetical protein
VKMGNFCCVDGGGGCLVGVEFSAGWDGGVRGW